MLTESLDISKSSLVTKQKYIIFAANANRKKKMGDKTHWIPLTDGAALARISYGVLLRKVLVGQVCGKRVDGHWQVARQDVKRLSEARVGAEDPEAQ